jgi:CDP-2,3-bis-(O-geranylgeranyl)-sn-glycerol synthase
VGLSAGVLAGAVLSLTPYYVPQFDLNTKLLIAFLLSCGTLAGDLVGSFVKRRIGIGRGGKLEVFDQLLFFAFALAFCAVIYLPPADEIAFLAVITYILHKVTNQIAYWLKLKAVPW